MIRARRLTRFLSGVVLGTAVFASVTPAAHAVAASDLAASIRAYIDTLPSDYTVSVRELDGDQRTIGIDENLRVEPASVIKLFYAWATLRRVDLGSLRLSQTMPNGLTWERCLTLMITVSDNKCSADIRTALGNRTLNTLFAASGYPNTGILLTATGAYNGKRTSAADTSLLLARLEQGTLLSPSSTTYFHQLLKDQVWRTRINLGVPAGVRVENKGGELWVTSGWTQSDAAIVRGPQSTYVITVFGRNEASKSVISGISRIVYEYLQDEPVTTPATFSTYQFTAAVAMPVRSSFGGRVLYTIPRGTLVKLFYSERNWVKVRQVGKPLGWALFPQLALRDQYRWE